MAVDRTKVLAAAQKHASKGNYDKAINEYKKLVNADPRDVRTWLKIGDLYTRKGAKKEATDTYHRVAEHYAKQGFFLKAVAVYKQILKLQPTRLDVSLRLAEMYENLQLISDALSTYEQVAGAYAREGQVEQMLETLGRMAELDPENIPVRIKYAEALSKAGKMPEAAEEFEAGAGLLRDQGRIDDYMKVAERLLYHRQSDGDLARDLASLYLERNDAKRALSKLQLCFKQDPKDVATLELLAQAFHVLGQTPKTISVYREIAKIHQDAGRGEERARALQKILEHDPNDAEARQGLASFAQQKPKAPAPPPPAMVASMPPGAVVGAADDPLMAASHDALMAHGSGDLMAHAADDDDDPLMVIEEADDDDPLMVIEEADDDDPLMVIEEADDDPLMIIDDEEDDDPLMVIEEEDDPAIDILEADEDIMLVDDELEVIEDVELVSEPAPPPGAVVSPPAASSAPSISPEVAHEAQIARLMTECDVFLRYGLKDKVIAQLEEVLSLAPEHVEARERLKDALIDANRSADAAEQLVALSDMFAADRPQLANLYLRQARELDPSNATAAARLGEVPAHLSNPPPPAEFSDETNPNLIGAPRQSSYGDERPSLDPARMSAVPPTHKQHESLIPSAMELPEPVAPSAPAPSSPAHMAPIGSAVDSMPLPAAPAASSIPSQRSSDAALALELPEALDAPISQAEFDQGPVDTNRGHRAKAEERSSVPPGEIEETLDEADFFMAQGLWDEARGTIDEALETHPGHPLLVDKLQEINEAETARASSLPEPSSAPNDAFALAEQLAEELGPQAAEDDEAIDLENVFEQFKKGVEEQIGADDSDTHFDLGIAYKEMGLHNDAISEFQLAMNSPARLCICETMIGLCYMEQQNYTSAISHFKRGLYAELKSPREELGLYFELGVAYEALNDQGEALYYYEKVRKQDPSFRAVQQRIAQVSQASAQQAPLHLEDVDVAFDDLIQDD